MVFVQFLTKEGTAGIFPRKSNKNLPHVSTYCHHVTYAHQKSFKKDTKQERIIIIKK